MRVSQMLPEVMHDVFGESKALSHLQDGGVFNRASDGKWAKDPVKRFGQVKEHQAHTMSTSSMLSEVCSDRVNP
jgi:hypothetical protein